jgi:hypothetical protein
MKASIEGRHILGSQLKKGALSTSFTFDFIFQPFYHLPSKQRPHLLFQKMGPWGTAFP